MAVSIAEISGSRRFTMQEQGPSSMRLGEYRSMLESAQVPQEQIDPLVEAYGNTLPKPGEERTIVEFKVSRTVAKDVQEAASLGINVAPILEKAAAATINEGRRKISKRGRTGEVLGELTDSIHQARLQRQYSLPFIRKED